MVWNMVFKIGTEQEIKENNKGEVVFVGRKKMLPVKAVLVRTAAFGAIVQPRLAE